MTLALKKRLILIGINKFLLRIFIFLNSLFKRILLYSDLTPQFNDLTRIFDYYQVLLIVNHSKSFCFNPYFFIFSSKQSLTILKILIALLSHCNNSYDSKHTISKNSLSFIFEHLIIKSKSNIN